MTEQDKHGVSWNIGRPTASVEGMAGTCPKDSGASLANSGTEWTPTQIILRIECSWNKIRVDEAINEIKE